MSSELLVPPLHISLTLPKRETTMSTAAANLVAEPSKLISIEREGPALHPDNAPRAEQVHARALQSDLRWNRLDFSNGQERK